MSERKKNMYLLLNSIYMCSKCVDDILNIYIYTSNIKCLCPHCLNDETECKYCSTKVILKNLIEHSWTENKE